MQLLSAQSAAVLGSHQFEVFYELDSGLHLLRRNAVVRLEHALESPLCPVIVVRVAGSYLTAPIKTEAYLVKLFAIAVDVLLGGNGGMLTRLYGILLCGQSVGVVAHGIQHVEAAEALIAGVDIAGDIAEGMSHVQAGAARVGEHIQHVEFLLLLILHDAVCAVLDPPLLPFLLNFSEVVFHNDIVCFLALKVQRYE